MTRPLLSVLLFLTTVSSIAFGQGRLPPCPSFMDQLSWDNCQGTQTFPNGHKLIGEFHKGKLVGQGTATTPAGNVYVGEFTNSIPNGRGTASLPNGEKYVGEIKNGLFHGQGSLTYQSGDRYVGEFKDGKRSGQGTYYAADGDTFVGAYLDDRRNGFGIATKKNGQRYVGEFVDGAPSGQGDLTLADKTRQVGEFRNGQFVGPNTSTLESQEAIKMERSGGVYTVPVRFNDSITLSAVVDSGASDVSIPADLLMTLIRTKTVTEEDFLGRQIYVLADGSKVPSQQFRIRSLKVGNKTIENVVAGVASVNATILLGQGFLSSFKSWSIDNEKHVLILN